MIGERLRIWLRFVIDPAADAIARSGISPNALSIVGAAAHIGVAWLLGRGHLLAAAMLLLLTSGIDGIDAALTAIEAGEFAGTVAWDPLWTGGMGLAIPYAHATGKIDIAKEGHEHREFYGTGIIVTKDTVAGYKSNPGTVDFNDLWGKATGQIQYRG